MSTTMSKAKTFSITFVCALLFFMMPTFLAPYPQAAPVAAAFQWAGDTYLQGFSALAFLVAGCTLSSLVSDAYKWLTRAKEATPAPAPTPAELEDGTASPLLVEPEAETAVAAAEPTTPKEAKAKKAEPSTRHKIMSFFCMAFLFTTQVYNTRIISLQKPFLENAIAGFTWLLRGFEILLVAFILLIAYGCVLLRVRARAAAAAAAAAPAPAPVLFDDGAAEYPAEKKVEVFNEKEEEKEESKDVAAENEKLVDA